MTQLLLIQEHFKMFLDAAYVIKKVYEL